MDQSPIIKWNIAYKMLATLLVEFYKINSDSSGEKLYQLLNKDAAFKENNNWFENHQVDKDLVGAVTPLQVYASFNNIDTTEIDRTNQFKFFFKILTYEINRYSENIEILDLVQEYSNLTTSNLELDYETWIGFYVKDLLLFRRTNEQLQVWIHFVKITVAKNENESKEELKKALDWYGFDLISLSIYMYWVNSDSFYPLNGEVNNLLDQKDKTRIILKNFEEYGKYIASEKQHIYRDIVRYSREDFLEKYSGDGEEYNKISKNVERLFSIRPGFDRKGDFKILGVQLGETKNDIYNSLKEGTLYQFYDCFKFLKEDESEYIDYDTKRDLDLFNLDSGLNVSVSAIVGKNGSGKSTLLELIYRIIYNISFRLDYIENPLWMGDEKIQLKAIDDLEISLYVKTNGIYKIEVKGKSIKVYKYQKTDDQRYKRNKSEIKLNQIS